MGELRHPWAQDRERRQSKQNSSENYNDEQHGPINKDMRS